MEFVKKYSLYILAVLFSIALIWGVYNYISASSLENQNKNLVASNAKLISDFKSKQAQWENQFYNLEVKAKQMEATIKKLNANYAVLVKKSSDLEKKLASIKIPVEKEEKIAKFKELGYDTKGIVSGSPATHDGALFDWNNSDKILRDVMEVQVIKEINVNLKESVAILEKKVSVQDEIIKNTEAEVRMALSRAEYAENIIVEKDKTIVQLGKVNEELAKKAKRATLWGAIGVGIGVVMGVFAAVFIGGL